MHELTILEIIVKFMNDHKLTVPIEDLIKLVKDLPPKTIDYTLWIYPVYPDPYQNGKIVYKDNSTEVTLI